MKKQELDMQLVHIAQKNHIEKKQRARKLKCIAKICKAVRTVVIGIGFTLFGCATIAAGAMDFEAEAGSLHANHEQYPRTTVVKEIDMAMDLVVLRDCTGHEWTFHGIEDWMVGDICSILLDNMETAIIDDDEIIGKKHNGTIENYIIER